MDCKKVNWERRRYSTESWKSLPKVPRIVCVIISIMTKLNDNKYNHVVRRRWVKGGRRLCIDSNRSQSKRQTANRQKMCIPGKAACTRKRPSDIRRETNRTLPASYWSLRLFNNHVFTVPLHSIAVSFLNLLNPNILRNILQYFFAIHY